MEKKLFTIGEMVRLIPGTVAASTGLLEYSGQRVNINCAEEMPAIVAQTFNEGLCCNLVVFTPLNGAVSLTSVPAGYSVVDTYTGPYFKAAPCPIP